MFVSDVALDGESFALDDPDANLVNFHALESHPDADPVSRRWSARRKALLFALALACTVGANLSSKMAFNAFGSGGFGFVFQLSKSVACGVVRPSSVSSHVPLVQYCQWVAAVHRAVERRHGSSTCVVMHGEVIYMRPCMFSMDNR